MNDNDSTKAIITMLAIDSEDFAEVPFNQLGGLGRATSCSEIR